MSKSMTKKNNCSPPTSELRWLPNKKGSMGEVWGEMPQLYTYQAILKDD